MSLCEEWPTLSPRERDARVAQALGGILVERMYGALGTKDEIRVQMVLLPDPRRGRHKDDERCFRLGWTEFLSRKLDSTTLRDYSTSWEHAGPLLDRLREEGWRIVLRADARGWDVMEAHAPEGTEALSRPWDFECRAETGPSLVSLLFCLAMDAKEKP